MHLLNKPKTAGKKRGSVARPKLVVTESLKKDSIIPPELIISAIDINLPGFRKSRRKKRSNKPRTKSSKFPNVCWMKVGQNWRAKKQHSTPDGTTHHLKAQFFPTEHGAAKCVDDWIRNLIRQYPQDTNLTPLLPAGFPNCEEGDEAASVKKEADPTVKMEMSEDEKLREGLRRVKEAEAVATRGKKRSRELPKLRTPEKKRRRCGYPGCAKLLRAGDRLLPVGDMMVCNADYQYHRKHGYLTPINERQKGKNRQIRRKETTTEEDAEYIPPSMMKKKPPRIQVKEMTLDERIKLNTKAFLDATSDISKAQREEKKLKRKLDQKTKERVKAEQNLASLQEMLNIPELVSTAFDALVQNKLLTEDEVGKLLTTPAEAQEKDDFVRFGCAISNSQLAQELKLKILFLLEQKRITNTKAIALFEAQLE